MKRAVRTLMDAEKALAEGDANCGGGEDNVFHAPLLRVRAEIKRLVAAAPALDLLCAWAAGEVNHVSVLQLRAAAKKVRAL